MVIMVRFQFVGLVCIWIIFVAQTVFSQEELVCGQIGGTWNCLASYGHLTNTTGGCDIQGTCDPNNRYCDRSDVFQWSQVIPMNHNLASIEEGMGDELKAHIVVCLWNTFCMPKCELRANGWKCKNSILAIPIGGLDWYSVGPCGGGGGPGGPESLSGMKKPKVRCTKRSRGRVCTVLSKVKILFIFFVYTSWFTCSVMSQTPKLSTGRDCLDWFLVSWEQLAELDHLMKSGFS